MSNCAGRFSFLDVRVKVPLGNRTHRAECPVALPLCLEPIGKWPLVVATSLTSHEPFFKLPWLASGHG